MENKIDFVMIWVDGNDQEWRKEKNHYENKSGDDRNIRFRDWDNLQYWFRAVEEYAPWVNKIHFVTWGHLPQWLDTTNPQINIVNHKDFIPAEYLPTFSSHVIELNLHRIPGLSEQFVYFNDDMFVFNRVSPEYFFVKGLPCDAAIQSPAIKENKFAIGNVVMNNMAIINTYFDKNMQMRADRKKWFNRKYDIKNQLKNYLLKPWNSFTGFYEFHVANSFLKSTFEKIWQLEGETLNEVCLHRFRDLKLDVNQWLMRDWQLASNQFYVRKTNSMQLYTIDKDSDIKKVFNQNVKLICFNDSEELTDEEYELAKKTIIDCFEKKLPRKSAFEK